MKIAMQNTVLLILTLATTKESIIWFTVCINELANQQL